MKRVVSSLSFVLFAAATALRAQNPMTAEVTAAYKGVSANILKAAEKMPDADYGFKPAPEFRTFGQLIAHVADAQMALCGGAKGEMKRGDAAKKTSKAESGCGAQSVQRILRQRLQRDDRRRGCHHRGQQDAARQ